MTMQARAARLSERLGRQVWIWFDLGTLRLHATLSFRPGHGRLLVAIVIGDETMEKGKER